MGRERDIQDSGRSSRRTIERTDYNVPLNIENLSKAPFVASLETAYSVSPVDERQLVRALEHVRSRLRHTALLLSGVVLGKSL